MPLLTASSLVTLVIALLIVPYQLDACTATVCAEGLIAYCAASRCRYSVTPLRTPFELRLGAKLAGLAKQRCCCFAQRWRMGSLDNWLLC